jgi:hypothetical protein
MPAPAPVYQPWNLQQINGGGLTAGPAAVSDPFASIFDSQQHIGYLGPNGTIWDSWFDGATAKWNLQQINAGGATKGPIAVGGPFIWVWNQKQQHFTYRGQKGLIWDAWYDGQWSLQQINDGGVTKGLPAVSDPFASVFGSQQHIGYLDSAGWIWDSWYDGHWNLQQINAGGVTKGPAAAGGLFIWTDGSQQHFTYRDKNGTIWDSWYDGQWNLQQINGAGGLTSGPPAVGNPFACVFGSQEHIFYRDNEGTIWDSWYSGHGWSLQHLNTSTGVTPQAPVAAGDPFASFFGKQQLHVAYRDAVGAIWDSWYDGSLSRWNLQRINANGLTKGPAAAGGPFVWTVGTEQQHFTYRDQKGTIFDSWYNHPPESIPSPPTGVALYVYSVNLTTSGGAPLPNPIAGQPFKMSINILNGGGANAPASTLTVVMSASDDSAPQTFSGSVSLLHPGAGANVVISVPALSAGLTYDFNFFDPSSTEIGYLSYSL